MATVGVKVIFNDLPKLLDRHPHLAGEALAGLAFEGERFMKEGMRESPATGRTYTRKDGKKGSVTHIASRAGNFPRPDIGNLRNSIHVEKASLLTYFLVAGTDYAYYLEFGTSKMAARPFFVPTLHYLRENAVDFFDGFM